MNEEGNCLGDDKWHYDIFYGQKETIRIVNICLKKKTRIEMGKKIIK